MNRSLEFCAAAFLAGLLAVPGRGGDVGDPLTREGKPNGAEKARASKRESAKLVRGLTQADVRWDGQYLGITAVLQSKRAKRLAAIGAPAVPELIQAMSDKEKFASAHALLTLIASGGKAGDPVICNNGIAVYLPAEGPVSIDPAQRFELQKRWEKWSKRTPRPKALPK